MTAAVHMNSRRRAQEVPLGLIVTIDGPAGSGKSTTAALLAERLGLTYLDTGAMYRAVALAAIRRGIDPDNEAEVARLAGTIALEVGGESPRQSVFLDGINIDREIRTPEVSRAVSPVSRHDGVRRAMVRIQRRIGARGGIVAEGRDTGSVVFPHAAVKVFLVADLDARARRRFEQLRSLGITEDIEAIRENIRARDTMDAGRANSPLVRPVGAITVDTSHLSIAEQVDEIERAARVETERITRLAVGAGEENPFAAMNLYYRITHLFVRGFFRVVFGLVVSGREHLRYRENFIFASNHISYADSRAVGYAFDREVWFLAKKELFRNRFFGGLIRRYHAIPVDREEIERKTMKQIFEILRAGHSILMFPEGTRSRDGALREFKPGLGFTALNAGVSIIPVYVEGTNRLGACLARRAALRVAIGPPIRIAANPPGAEKKNDYRVLTRMVESELRMLRDESQA